MKLLHAIAMALLVGAICTIFTWLWRDAVHSAEMAKLPPSTVLIVHDTTYITVAVKPPGIVPKPGTPVHDSVFVHCWQPAVAEVTVDTTLEGVKVGITYELPTALKPLGIFSRMEVSCPSIVDTVTIRIPYPVEVVKQSLAGWICCAAATVLLVLNMLVK